MATTAVRFRNTGELTLAIPALPRPTLKELRKEFPWIREKDGIERDTSSIEAVTLNLGTVLGPEEGVIIGPEYEDRLQPLWAEGIVLGYQHWRWLRERRDDLVRLPREVGYIDFSGIVVVHAYGRRSFPYILGRGRRWDLGWNSLGRGLGRDGRIAVSGK